MRRTRNSGKDRLADIWSGFADRTALDLSGVDIDHTPRPSARHEADPREAFRDAGAKAAWGEDDRIGPDPVAAALSALHGTPGDNATGRRSRRRGATPDVSAAASDPSAPPVSALEQTLLADMAFTRSKTARREGDYLSFAAARQDAWKNRRRKKFLGLF